MTLEHLNGSYKVEPGDGQSRDSYLKEHGVVTFLVVNPKVRRRPTGSVRLPYLYLHVKNDPFAVSGWEPFSQWEPAEPFPPVLVFLVWTCAVIDDDENIFSAPL